MTSFDEKLRSALAKAQTMAKPAAQSETVVDGTVASVSKQNTDLPKPEGNPLIKISKFDFRPLYSRVDINCDKWLMTMSEESRGKLEHPPSLDDGIDFQTEQEIRFLGCELIQEGAILLKLPQTAAATGQILFHRFYYQRSFLKYWFQHTVMACLLLASKIEEAPRRPRDIYNIFHRLEQLHNLKNKGRPITIETTAQLKPADINQKYMNAKTHVLNTEKRMMSCLGFVVHVKHPHKLIISYIFTLGYGVRNDFIQKAWSYMNDGLRTDMFVRYKPETIACACIFVAARTVEEPIPLPSQPFHWFELFDASDRDVYTIANQLMTLYARQKPVNMNRLVHILDKMREEKETAELAEKARQAALIAAKLSEIKEKHERSVDKTSRKRSPSRSRTRSPRKKHSPKKRRDSPDRKYKSNGRERDRRDDKDRRDRNRRDNRDERRRRSHSRDRRSDRDYDHKDRSKMRSDTIYETLKNRQREVPIKPRK